LDFNIISFEVKKKDIQILLIYTGGTIGMVKDYKTGALKAFNFDKLLDNVPELQLIDCVIDNISFRKPIDSSNMNTTYWLELAAIIEDNYSKYNGFVVLHGSDTMSYTSSALSFMLENLAKPIIFTGSQLPIGDLRTDAKENLITAIQIATLQENNEPVLKEVCLYFEYKLYRANRSTKINTDHFSAFSSFNYPTLAESGVYLKVNKKSLLRKNNNMPLVVQKAMDKNITILKLFPGLSEQVLNCVLEIPNLKALILETFGAGNAPIEKWMVLGLKKAINKGIYIVNVTQCSGGGVAMGKYQTSKHLKDLQIINGKDITTESAVAKLMYLLGKNISRKKFKIAFETSIRGEMQ